jgi:superfamily II DNA or RNA helicase
MEITEKWLGEIAGWQVMKAARSLVAGGQVEVTTVQPDLVQGNCGPGKKRYRCGLKINSRSDVENLCTCITARRTGAMCEHSIAVALASLTPKEASTRPSRPSAPDRQRPEISPPAKEVEPIPGRFSIYLPQGLKTGAIRFPANVFLEYEKAAGEAESLTLSSWLTAHGVGPQTVPLSLPEESWDPFLQAIADHPRVFVGKPSSPVATQVADAPQSLPVSIELVNGDEVALERQDQDWAPAGGKGNWWFCEPTGSLFPLRSTEGREATQLLEELVRAGSARRPIRWWVQHGEALQTCLQLEARGAGMAHFHVLPAPSVFEFEVDGSLQNAILRVKVRLGELSWALADKGPVDEENRSVFPVQDESERSSFYVRNGEGESRAMDVLEDLGFQLDASGEWRLRGQANILRFFGSGIPRLKVLGRVDFTQRWRVATRGLERIGPLVQPSTSRDSDEASGTGMDWLSMEFRYEAADGFRLGRNEVLRLVRSRQGAATGAKGKRYVVDADAIEAFEDSLQDVPLELTPEGARVHAWHAHAMPGVAEGSLATVSSSLLDSDEMRARLGDLATILRPYQLDGVRWLESLARVGRGGVLADDMGLGKTLQSIALLRAVESDGPSLVVCPKSLLGNWKAEFGRFVNDNHVILTTYALISRDLQEFQTIRWSVILLDEASHIRNPETAAAKAIRKLHSGCRFALTGTPIENTVRDLWSILHFALPGYLGDRDHFKERFEAPLAAGPGTPAGLAASERLRRLVKPFFLRRTKGEVLKELPKKIEQVLWCDPTPAQAELYSKILDEGRDEIRAARKRSGEGGARMTMFTVLLRLRQVCCDLRLTGLAESALDGLSGDELSAKWAVWRDRLEQVLTCEGKVLIFSQFVSFLRLVRDNLEELNINYCYLDGSTSNRQQEVDRFQKEPEQRVFLISLKAGGYGLNLTAADHVFLMDPWWNPAVESQAIDRAHRMGQTKVVKDGMWSDGVSTDEMAEMLGV